MKLSVFALLLSTQTLWGQTTADSTLRAEIDRQIWRPFIEAFNGFDAERFNGLHTPDVLRATSRGLSRGETYFQQNRDGFQKGRAAGSTRRIAFTFEHRVHQADIAYEVGYYRLVSGAQGAERTFYGQFHVVLKKIAGSWKIAQDWDSGQLGDRSVSEADFLRHAGRGLYE